MKTERYFIIYKPVNMVSQFISTHQVKLLGDLNFDFPDGTAITILNDNAAGNLTIQAASSGTTAVSSAGAIPAAPVVGPFKAAVCLKIANNDWVVVGAIS
jgi:23S rRNA pseudouridine2457 synthase